MIRLYTPGEAGRLRTAAAGITRHLEGVIGGVARRESGVRRIHDEGMPLARRLTVGTVGVQTSAAYRFPGTVTNSTILGELRALRREGIAEIDPHIASAERALTISPAADVLMMAGSAAIQGGLRHLPAATQGGLTLQFDGDDERLDAWRWELAAAGLCANLDLPREVGRALLPGIYEQVEVTLGAEPTVRRSPMRLLPEEPHPDHPRLFITRNWANLQVRLLASSEDPELGHSRVGVMAAGLEFLARTTDIQLTF
ncbi:MAG: hypothetical protein HY696_09425 [Deltaproteobacteria bacterium]|nr:hypothetical protein [Deltaproteobacteria bacterium]